MTTEVAFTHLRTWTTSCTRYFFKYIMMYDQVVKICSTNIVMLLVSKKISARYDELKIKYLSSILAYTCSIISGSRSAPLFRRDTRESATFCRKLKIFKCTRICYTQNIMQNNSNLRCVFISSKKS